ncbi:metalloproteinase, variant 3 [Blastomyces dermatitidis ATCC 18188]|uniref:Neutral protease 2 n=1 Tax=Ajellomyces dermatitidis (strain ATCC 18188 / CBS 674.68) TaxID=653446 RepID=F2T219_AJEDA|nr:metalloproteinase [Blastomyces dermatitidis ATCC 18188]EQL33577.1 hypothetical protein BDFG_04334 [Blastomyces dermatitidis ATCC 26199]EQL33578.1 hypothetical protein, variant 1 [Blastomyces dermatitidis ATCC 26199]EQL33579.1 hypothetical protein, variant 2 [Blastomyces dermatitidis ATCC 26199]EQL33580.1 hypothetical protein, variant 3 [Blastomyces dermatitidis ATCC 26199]
MQLSSVLLTAAGLLAPIYSSAIISIGRRSEGLDVSLASTGNTKVQVSVTNTGSSEISILRANTLFDASPTKKFTVYKEGSRKEVPFKGVHLRRSPSDLAKDNLQPIGPGQTIDKEFDLAETLNLSESGTYIVSADGVFPIIDPKSFSIASVIPYESNELKIEVDGKQVSGVLSTRAKIHDHLAQRADFNNGNCTDHQKAVIASALKRDSSIAGEASNAALSGDVRVFEQYFRTTDPSIRQQVSDRFHAISNEACSAEGGVVKYQCEDEMDVCRPDTVAYALSGSNVVVNCPIYYSVTAVSQACDAGDQALTVIHELSHIDAVYYPATTDLAYGEDASMALNADMSIRNADSYTFYANAVRQNCNPS